MKAAFSLAKNVVLNVLTALGGTEKKEGGIGRRKRKGQRGRQREEKNILTKEMRWGYWLKHREGEGRREAVITMERK